MTGMKDTSSLRLTSDEDVLEGLARLIELDPRLALVRDRADPVTRRSTGPSLKGLLRIIIAQQVSTSAANAIEAKFLAAFPDLSPALLLAASEDDLRAAGLSRPKVRTIRAICEAIDAGLDLGALVHLPAGEAAARLIAIKGIGPWTAEIFLLFGCGHADVMPAGDLALQVAVTHAFALPARISADDLRKMATVWSPWRGVAAKLFWAYHHARSRTGWCL